jgi:hypothetical protein
VDAGFAGGCGIRASVEASLPTLSNADTEAFEKIETDRIGLGKHEEFHRMMDELAGIYLDRK